MLTNARLGQIITDELRPAARKLPDIEERLALLEQLLKRQIKAWHDRLAENAAKVEADAKEAKEKEEKRISDEKILKDKADAEKALAEATKNAEGIKKA